MATRFRMNDGDWVCAEPQCGNVNFARRTSCNRCGKEKVESSKKKKLGTEIGKVAAEKSRGLFSADDWQCSKCGNVNWARRQQCNMCNAPKFGEVEERTGYGGGYNERENVEYIEREESDGEYDEYGRKKKQYRGKGEGSSSDNPAPDLGSKFIADEPKTEIQSQQTKIIRYDDEEEEEEEDDDDEEADLSKYDLSGWGDTTDSTTGVQDESDNDRKKQRSSSSSSTSRSRSRSPSSRKRKLNSDSRSRSR